MLWFIVNAHRRSRWSADLLACLSSRASSRLAFDRMSYEIWDICNEEKRVRPGACKSFVTSFNLFLARSLRSDKRENNAVSLCVPCRSVCFFGPRPQGSFSRCTKIVTVIMPITERFHCYRTENIMQNTYGLIMG